MFDKEVLKEGVIPDFDGNKWHTLKLTFQNKEIEAFIDAVSVVNVSHQKTTGYVMLASSYDENLFDDLEITH